MTEMFKGIGNNLIILEHLNNLNNNNSDNKNNYNKEYEEILNTEFLNIIDHNNNILIKINEKFINDRIIYNYLNILYNNDEIETLKDLCENFKLFDDISNMNNFKLFIFFSQNLNIDRETIKYFFQKISCFLYNNIKNVTEKNLSVIFNYLDYIYRLKYINFHENKDYFSIFEEKLMLEIKENNLFNLNDKKNKKKKKKKKKFLLFHYHLNK